MKWRKVVLTIVVVWLTMLGVVLADEVESPNYKIEGLTIGGGEDYGNSTNYAVDVSLGEIAGTERLQSSSYKLGTGVEYVYMATPPSVKCFETTTEGSTSCDYTGVNPDGMVMLCGYGGCYDRARFELDTGSNPSDTVYSIQITIDSSWSTWQYVDGSTFYIEDASSHDINDYLTEAEWEGTSSGFNIYGLQPNTTYYIRVTALHGDFTESDPGPQASATTGLPTLFFDLDIGDSGSSNVETSAPYSIDLTADSFNTVFTANDLIWMDIGSNAVNGLTVSVHDLYAGLYSSNASYTVNSVTGDLDSLSEGYGIVENSSTAEYGGPLTVNSIYGGSGNNVGKLDTTNTTLYTSNWNVYNGRCSLYVKAKYSFNAPVESDYTDTITFSVVGSF